MAARIQQHAPEARDQPQGGGDAPVAVPGAAPGDASRTGTVMGTPLWMAPEMISDGICEAAVSRLLRLTLALALTLTLILTLTLTPSP